MAQYSHLNEQVINPSIWFFFFFTFILICLYFYENFINYIFKWSEIIIKRVIFHHHAFFLWHAFYAAKVKCSNPLFKFVHLQEVNAVFELGDADRDGEIDLKEFIGVMTTSSPVAYKVQDINIIYIKYIALRVIGAMRYENCDIIYIVYNAYRALNMKLQYNCST